MEKLKRLRIPLLWLIVVLLLEVFLFNLPSFYLIGGKYEKSSLPLADAVIEDGVFADDSIAPGDGVITVRWSGIDRRIGTVSLDLTWADAVSAALQVDASDDTHAGYRYDIASADLFAGDRRSQTVILRLSGEVHDLRLTITAPGHHDLRLAGVTVNSPVPFRFSLLRSGVLWLLGLFVWLYLAWEPMRRPCSENKKGFALATHGITLSCLLIAVLMTGLYATDHANGFLSEWTLTSGNQITQELVDAFEHGQVHLLEQPSEELLHMDNPYDWSAREQLHVSYLWDHCLYNGKYYSYYGIAPVLLLFLPYHLLTGYYFSTIFAIFLFGGVGICFLTLTYRVFILQFFPRLPLRLAIFGLLTLQLSSGVWFCFCAMNFYEIAQSAGFCFVTMGAYFLLSANVIGKGRISGARLALSAICLSLAVLSRPTTAVYCVVALIFLSFGLKKLLLVRKDKTAARGIGLAGYLCAALLPYVLLGGLQMIYNYLRFDSFLDFGIRYSLTINDFTRSEFHARFVSIGLYNYLLAPPVISPTFPYVASSFQTLHPNGYYFVANTYAVGLIWRAIPVLGLLAAPKALRRLDKEKRLPAALLVGAVSVAAPLAVLFSIWESGYGVRYAVDFGWEMVIGALSILFFLYETGKNEGVRLWSSKAALWSLLPTATANMALIYAFFTSEVASPAALAVFHHLESIFSFWL